MTMVRSLLIGFVMNVFAGGAWAITPTVIDAGGSHTCALTTAGGVQCWGYNEVGQLGDSTTTNRLTPVAVSSLSSGVTAVTTGENHTCALTTAGAVFCWGHNWFGQLGNGASGSGTDQHTPMAVSGLSSGVAAIEAGKEHTCALTTSGGVQCWGRNNYGQLGDGTTTSRTTPVAVSGLSSGVLSIAAGFGHNCVVTMAGAMRCWGRNNYGQLGDGTMIQRTTPVAVGYLSSGMAAVTTGEFHSCALTTAGEAWCWGWNAYGQMGDTGTTQRLMPWAVFGMNSGAQAISAGQNHVCALTPAGAVKCWGSGELGQLGDGTQTTKTMRVAVIGLSSGVVAITAGYSHTCALMATGAMKCWGVNGRGPLGDGTTSTRTSPVFVLRDGDGDGVLDAADAFPLDATETLDTDSDGTGNNTDHDDDGDGTPDVIDHDPLNPTVNESELPLNTNYKGSSTKDDVSAR